MYFITNKQLNFIPSHVKGKSNAASNKYRFNKLEIDAYGQGSLFYIDNNKYIPPTLLYGLSIKECYSCGNLLLDSNIEISSNKFTKDQLQDFIDGMLDKTYSNPLSIDMGVIEIVIDYRYSRFAALYGVGMRYPKYNWRLYGSNDKHIWYLLHAASPDSLYTDPIERIKSYSAHWYFNYIPIFSRVQTRYTSTPHEYWGVLYGEPEFIQHKSDYTYDSYPGVSVSEVEFRSSIGGSNLCVGGISVRYNLNNIGVDGFDGITNSTVTRNGYGEGLAYRFPDKVLPIELAVWAKGSSDLSQSGAPNQLVVVYSDDGEVWIPHILLDTSSAWLNNDLYTEADFVI